jgi:hypothetical protein
LTSTVSAAGIGIKYTFESAEVEQKQTTCLDYGVYNPFENDVTATIFANGEFEDYQVQEQEVFVPGGTYNFESKLVPVCFKIPKLVENCDIPSKLTGTVAATLVKDNKLTGGVGATSKLSVSAPLELTVICGTSLGFAFLDSISPNMFLGIGVIAVLILIVFIVWLLKKRKKGKSDFGSKDKYMSKYSDMMVLHRKVAANIASSDEVEQYKSLRSELEDLRSKI